MVFDSHEDTGGSQHATTHRQIPAVVISPTQDKSTAGSQDYFEAFEPLGGVLPTLAPDGRHPRPGQRETRRTIPPGGEAIAQAAAQACQWLEQVQACCQGTPLQQGEARR